MEGQGRRHHRGYQEDSSQQDESKTAKRDTDGGGYPFYSSFMLLLSLSCSCLFCYPSNPHLFASHQMIMFDSNHTSSPNLGIQTSSGSLEHVSLRKGSSGLSWSSWMEGACTSGCIQTCTLDGMYDSGMTRHSPHHTHYCSIH